MNQTKESWHLSKSVPITLVLTIFMQTLALAWFLAGLNKDVLNNATHISDNKADIRTLEASSRRQDGTLIRIEENVKYIRETIEDMTIGPEEHP